MSDIYVQVDSQPTWVRVSQVAAVHPLAHPDDMNTEIVLLSGQRVRVEALVDDVMAVLCRVPKDLS